MSQSSLLKILAFAGFAAITLSLFPWQIINPRDQVIVIENPILVVDGLRVRTDHVFAIRIRNDGSEELNLVGAEVL